MALYQDTNENFYELMWRVRQKIFDDSLSDVNNIIEALDGMASFENNNTITLQAEVVNHTQFDESLQFFNGNVSITPIQNPHRSSNEVIQEINERVEFIADHVDKNVQAIVELGSGYGANLFRLNKFLSNKEIKYIGAEYTESGRNLCKKYSSLPGATQIQTEYVDHKQPDLSFLSGFDNILIFTCHSIEQVKHIPDEYFSILSQSAKHVHAIHMEPFGFQLDNSTPSSQRHKEHCIEKGWNLNFYDCLNTAHNLGFIRTLDIQKDMFNTQDGNPTSVAVWDNKLQL